MAPRPRDLCVSLMLSLLGACTGAITDAAPRAGEEQPPIPGSPEYCQEVTAEPGHVTLRRLNRTEFNNTVRDLLGTSQTPADAFPEDDESGDGFDNNGAILSLGDLLMEKYETAARELSLGALSAGSPLRERYLDCDAETRGETPCARDFIERFGLRAYRRPLDTREADRLVALYESARVEGEPHAEALEQTIRGILMSPNFLFRIELGAESPDVHRLGDFELEQRQLLLPIDDNYFCRLIAGW